MSSSNGPHVMQCLQQNLDFLTGHTDTQSKVLYNLSNALIGMYEDIEAEFQNLSARLTNIENQLRR